MKQTAVEWLVNQMKAREALGLAVSIYDLEMFAEQAKAMEKEQIEHAYLNGFKDEYFEPVEYYNETFSK